MRAGLLGSVNRDGEQWVAAWTDDQNKRRTERTANEGVAVIQVAVGTPAGYLR